MFNIIIATHGHLAGEFLSVLQSFFGQTKKVKTVELGDQGIDQFSKKVENVVEPLVDEPVIIFCDIVGGTPFNEFAKKSTAWENESYLFGGVSLPVLVETLNLRMQNKPLKDVVDKIEKMVPLTRFELKNVKGDDDE